MDRPTAQHRYKRDHVERSRELRREMTPAEKILWKELRGRRFDGFKFRRQQPIGNFIADFLCASARVIIELDGESHVGRDQPDSVRQHEIEAMGYRVLRFWNHDIYDDQDTVMETIWRACQSQY